MLVKLCEKIITIADTEDLTWEDKYSLIFREKYTSVLYNAFSELNIKFEYDDPDTDYQEDVLAFSNALKENLNRFTNIMNYVKLSTELETKIENIL